MIEQYFILEVSLWKCIFLNKYIRVIGLRLEVLSTKEQV